jgi:hypothetical protein
MQRVFQDRYSVGSDGRIIRTWKKSVVALRGRTEGVHTGSTGALCVINYAIERVGSTGKTTDFYSGVAEFESRPKHLLYYL